MWNHWIINTETSVLIIFFVEAHPHTDNTIMQKECQKIALALFSALHCLIDLSCFATTALIETLVILKCYQWTPLKKDYNS